MGRGRVGVRVRLRVQVRFRVRFGERFGLRVRGLKVGFIGILPKHYPPRPPSLP